MSSSKNSTDSKQDKRRKWPWITLLCFVLFIGLVRLALMTGPVHRWAKNFIVDTANNQLNPTLTVDKLSGDLWHSVTLTGIVLSDRDTVASVDTLHLEYSPLSYFGDAFKIHEVRIAEPFVKLRQQADSTWNVQQWMKPASDTTSGSTFAVSISSLLLDRGRLNVIMPQLQQDSSLIVDSLNIRGNVAMLQQGYRASVDDLNFKVKNTRLDHPVSVTAASEASDEQITLQKLVIATGNSLLEASGRAGLQDSVINANAEAKPLSWRDLQAFVDDMPVQQDVEMKLGVSGDTESMNIDFSAHAEGIESLSVHTTLRRDSAITITDFRATAGRLDLETFMGDTTMPDLQNLDLSASGQVPVSNYQEGELKGTLSAANINRGEYHLDGLQGRFTLNSGRADVHLEPVNNGDRLIADATLSDMWSDRPQVAVSFRGNQINLQNWMPDTSYTGQLTFNGRVSGTGWVPDSQPWNYRLAVTEGNLNGQRVDEATMRGEFSMEALTNRTDLKIAESGLSLQAEARNMQSTPVFSYALTLDNLNLADLSGMDEYATSLTGTLEGKGRGSSLEDLQLQTSVRMDSSIFKGEFINKLSANVQVEQSVAVIDSAELESGIADGHLNGRINLQDMYNTDNRMDMQWDVKDLSSFASLMDVEILQATGSIEGELRPAGRDSLIFSGNIDMENINYNSQFLADRVEGDVSVQMQENPQYRIDVGVTGPVVSSVSIQNMDLKTEGTLTESGPGGSFELSFSSPEKGRIDQAGTYRVNGDTSSVEITRFDLTSSLRTLSLQKPFHATYSGGAVQTDTLHIQNDDGSAFLELAVPYADTLQQRGYLQASELNLAVMQDALLNDTYLEGLLSGRVTMNRTDTSLTAESNIQLSKLKYNETELDTLQLHADVKDERLEGSLELHQGGELIVEGKADLPFRTKAPTDLSDEFFTKPVSGYLRLHKVELNRFSRLLEQMGYDDTDGTLQFDGELKGQAGEPQLNASVSLRDARLSGVPVDSLVASLNYDHPSSQLDIDASLTSMQQQAVVIDAQMPLNVDMAALEVALPGPDDSISIAVEANEFNLKALNDFLNPQMARNLEGRIDGKVDITGPRSELQTSGTFTLRNGAVRVMRANIRLDHIRSTIHFQPDEIVLENLRMKSGSGTLNADGSLALQQLVPGDMNLRVRAENFKAANTDFYNAIVNLDMKVGGNVDQPSLSGNLDVINGFVKLDNFGEKSVEQVELDTTLTPETQTSLYDSLALDLDVEFDRRFFVRNDRYLEMEIELDGQLDLLKDSGQDLEIFGTLNTSGGYARPLGKRFELEEGALAFSGPPDNPQINVRTLYEPPQAEQEIKIWYIIEGTVEDPQFKYESTPPMDLAGIISYTLFGQPFYKLNPAEQSVASSSSNNAAADFAVEVLLDRVEALATKRLGIDVVRIEQTRIGGDSGTSVTTGWYVNPKVFFAIQNVITGATPTTGFYLEYYLRENLKLILSQGNDNRQGVDVQWEHDY